MIRDLLYGPPTRRSPAWAPNRVIVRSTTIELDTVLEIARQAEQWASESGATTVLTAWTVVDPQSGALLVGAPPAITEEHLKVAGDPERARLLLDVTGLVVSQETFHASVDLRQRIATTVTVNVPGDAAAAERMTEQIATMIIENGTPRFDPRNWQRIAMFVPAAVLALLWLLLQITSPLPIAAMLFGWAIVLVVLAATVAIDRHGKPKREQLGPGVAGLRIRSISREAVRMNRANLHTNIKIIAITAPISIAVGVIGTAIAFLLGFKK